jgi:hypothetical protein
MGAEIALEPEFVSRSAVYAPSRSFRGSTVSASSRSLARSASLARLRSAISAASRSFLGVARVAEGENVAAALADESVEVAVIIDDRDIRTNGRSRS